MTDCFFTGVRIICVVAQQEYNKKVCLLGDPGVGKTSLIRRFVEDGFSDKYIHTIGTKVSKKIVEFSDLNTRVSLLTWDIVGQKSIGLLESYFKGAAGALVVCDVTRDDTLSSVDDWVKNVRKVAGDVPIVVIANKSDLLENAVVDPQMVAIAARRYGAPYYMTSAKTGTNVELAFNAIGRMTLGEPPLSA